MNRIVYIYTLCNPQTGEIRYVGKTVDLKKRLANHLYKKKQDYNYHKLAWILSLKKQLLIPKIEILDVCNESNWRWHENYWIEQIKAWGFQLTNLKDGGFGPYKVSNETREKLRIANIGKKRSQEAILKTAIANTGKKRNENFRKLMSKIHTGKKHTDSANEKNRLAHLGPKSFLYGKPAWNRGGVGFKHSEETKKLVSEMRKGDKSTSAKIVLNTQNGIYYETIQEAQKTITHLNLRQVYKRLSGYVPNNTYFIQT